ncbi:MAG: hypothetical protein V4490_04665 [Pseudomonadota bacterium]
MQRPEKIDMKYYDSHGPEAFSRACVQFADDSLALLRQPKADVRKVAETLQQAAECIKVSDYLYNKHKNILNTYENKETSGLVKWTIAKGYKSKTKKYKEIDEEYTGDIKVAITLGHQSREKLNELRHAVVQAKTKRGDELSKVDGFVLDSSTDDVEAEVGAEASEKNSGKVVTASEDKGGKGVIAYIKAIVKTAYQFFSGAIYGLLSIATIGLLPLYHYLKGVNDSLHRKEVASSTPEDEVSPSASIEMQTITKKLSDNLTPSQSTEPSTALAPSSRPRA